MNKLPINFYRLDGKKIIVQNFQTQFKLHENLSEIKFFENKCKYCNEIFISKNKPNKYCNNKCTVYDKRRDKKILNETLRNLSIKYMLFEKFTENF